MDMAERTTFQSAFSQKIGVGERVNIPSKKNHHNVLSKTSRSLWKNSTISLVNHWEDFFFFSLYSDFRLKAG
jgi:hypothetical protein